jgi:hypothetical protein
METIGRMEPGGRDPKELFFKWMSFDAIIISWHLAGGLV